MLRAPLHAVVALLCALLPLRFATASEDLQDLYFGEALYHAYQGHWFEALQRLDAELAQHYRVDEPNLDSLHYHVDDAEFSLGDFELRYGMHHRAGRAIRAVLEADVEDTVRNDAAYRLARLHFEKGQLEDALHALGRIDGRVPDAIRDDIEFLRANVYLGMQRPALAVETLQRMDASRELDPFVSYNLGIALLRDGREEAAFRQLEQAGIGGSEDPEAVAIRDKANLVLGTFLLEAGRYAEAKQYLDRVHLHGPFSAQAMLSSGWADVHAGDFERAVVPWKMLVEGEVTDSATQEGMLALPFAYGKLDIHGRAALYYGQALDVFGQEIGKLDASIRSIRNGNFLEALVREEIRQNKDWVIRLRSLPETPETFYLMELLASHDFQSGLQNYLDLADLRRKLEAWQTDLDAFAEMATLREQHYEPLLPGIDGKFRKLDSRMRLRLEQQQMLEQRLQGMLTAPRPEFLATAEERALLMRIRRLEQRIDAADPAQAEALMTRLDRVRGTLTWTLQTEYHERLTRFDENLIELRQASAALNDQYRQFVRVRQAATHSFEGYARPIQRLQVQVQGALGEVDRLMGRQGQVLEVVAIRELESRQERLFAYQEKARFALADSYDRATQAQARRVDTP